MNQPNQKRLLLRWIGWFFLITSIILFLIQLSFLKYLPNLHEIHGASTGNILLTLLYLLTSYVTQSSILAFAAGFITLMIALFIPKRRLIFSIAILLTSALIICQVMDVIVFRLYNSHELVVGLNVMKTGASNLQQVIPISFKELISLILIISGTVAIQLTATGLIWRQIKKQKPARNGRWFALGIVVCFCLSYGLMAGVVTLPSAYQLKDPNGLLILKSARLVPYYSEVYSFLMPINNKYERTIHVGNQKLSYQTQQPVFPLHYPLSPMHCSPKKPLPNILFIVVDTWRYDAMSEKYTPNIHRFAKKTLQFNDEWSGGNCTLSGIFTLFYGIPANYWSSSIRSKKGPVLIQALEKNHYQMAIYGSATLEFPEFDKNVFRDIPHLKVQTQGENTVERDKSITKEFTQFLKTRNNKKPFFGFIFYDAAHNYCDGGEKEHQSPFKPAIKACKRFTLTRSSDPTPYLNRYHNAVHFIDHEIGQVLKQLKASGLYKNTIIIITADHGEQFNDEKLGLWSHNSAYSPYQLHVPLLIYWPGKSPEKISYLTTHYDIAPTLLTQVFGCTTPIKNYSTGQSLFKPNHTPYTIAGNYTNYAVVTKKRITRFYPNGAYAIQTPMSRQMPYAVIDTKIIRQANQDLKRYYQ